MTMNATTAAGRLLKPAVFVEHVIVLANDDDGFSMTQPAEHEQVEVHDRVTAPHVPDHALHASVHPQSSSYVNMSAGVVMPSLFTLKDSTQRAQFPSAVVSTGRPKKRVIGLFTTQSCRLVISWTMVAMSAVVRGSATFTEISGSHRTVAVVFVLCERSNGDSENGLDELVASP